MDQQPTSRRAVLRGLGAGGLLLALPLLAACGSAAAVATTSASPGSRTSTTTSAASALSESSAAAAASTSRAATSTATTSSATATSTGSVVKTVTSSAAASKATGSVEFWSPWTGPQYEGPTGMIARIDAAFNAKHPELHIAASTVGSGVVEKLLASVAAGTPPDVVVVTNGNGDVYSLASKGAIQPAEAVAGPDLSKVKDWFHPAIWDLGVYQGKVWAPPMWTQGYALMWDKNAFQQAGVDPSKMPIQTLDELPQLSQKLSKQTGGTYTQLGFWDTWFDCCSQLAFMNYAAYYGGTLMDPTTTKVTLNDPNNVKALQWMVSYLRLMDLDKVKAFEKTLTGLKQGPNLAGKIVLWRDGPWRLRTIQLDNLPNSEFGAGPVPPPAGVTGGGQSHYGDIPVIPRGAKATDAWQFIRFLTGVDGEESYAELLTIQPQIPNSQTFTKGAAFKKVLAQYPGFEVWLDAFYNSTHFITPPKIPTASTYFSVLKAFANQAFTGTLTPQDALEQATSQAQHDLDAALAK